MGRSPNSRVSRTAVEGARRATAGDARVVAELARQAISELSPNRGGRVWSLREGRREPIEGPIEAVVGSLDPTSCSVVGTVDEAVIGYGIGHLETLNDGSVLAVVTDLYVAPEARAIGVGEAMMDLLIQWARDHDAIGIDALALPGDRHTKNFFETFGLTARAIVVHRSLVEPAGATDAG